MAALPDVKHNLSPVIGWLRMSQATGKPLTEGQVASVIEKLQAAVAAVELEEAPKAQKRGHW